MIGCLRAMRGAHTNGSKPLCRDGSLHEHKRLPRKREPLFCRLSKMYIRRGGGDIAPQRDTRRPHPKQQKKEAKQLPQRGSGSDLSSRAVSSQVLSALESLTTVFGMGTGGTSPSLPPVDFQGLHLAVHPDNCTNRIQYLQTLQLISLFL